MKAISAKRLLSVMLLDASTRKRLARLAGSLCRPVAALPQTLRRPVAALLAMLLPLIGTVTFLAPQAQAAVGSIVFSSNRNGNYRIFVMNNNGTAQTQVTNPGASFDDKAPDWSPDASQILFVREDTDGDIWVMNRDGSGQTQLTSGNDDDQYPDWSPDGTEIIYESDSAVWKMNADGSGAQRITFVNENPALTPTWSPDGTRVAYSDGHTGPGWKISTLDPDGTDRIHLVASAGDNLHPVYSGDGTRMAFASDRDGNWNIYTMDEDGSNETRVTTNVAVDDFPAWTPDSDIAFVSMRTGNHDIFTIQPDGSGITQLTTSSGEDKDPDWAVSDVVAPLAPSFTSVPADPSGNPGPSWSFTGEASGSYQCELRRGATIVSAFANCSSPKTFSISPIVEGTYTMAVKQTDDAGNVGPETTDSFTLDMIDPQSTLDSAPSGTITSTDASFTFHSDVLTATYECSMDGSPFVLGPCSSPADYTGLGQGAHTFEVRAVDGYGWVDPTPASATFDVDTVGPPSPTIDSGPAGTGAADDVTFTFSGPGSSFECAIDAGSYSSCSSPKAYTNLSDGPHSFDVRSLDQWGNPSTPTSRAFTVDTTAPETSIDSGPTGTISSNQATFWFSADESGSTFECKIDSGNFQSCTSTTQYTGLTDGPHNFKVRATDAVGNTDQSPDSRDFSVDTTGPVVSIDSGPSGPIKNDSPSFGFSTSDATDTFECKLDGASYTACSSPLDYTGLAETTHTFSVRATDQFGNPGADATSTFTVDLTAPELPSVTSAPPALTSSPDATFEFSTDDASDSFMCSLDGSPDAPCSSGIVEPSLSDGMHTFWVHAVDTAGNHGTTAQVVFTVDTAGPETTIDSGPNGLISSDQADYEFSSDEAGTFECSLDGGPFVTCTSPMAYTVLSDGIHDFAVRAIDQVGHVDPSPAAASIVVDTTAPALVTITSGPSGPVKTDDVSFEFTSDDSSNHFECSLDAGAFSNCTSPADFNDLPDGNHILGVRAVDDADNTGPSTLRSFKVDTVAPGDPVVDSGASGNVPTDSVTFQVHSADPTATFECSMDGSAFTPCSSNPNYSSLGEGGHSFSVVAVDPAGNKSGTTTADFTVDTIEPGGATITSGPSGNVNTNAVSFGFTSGDVSDHFECSVDAGSFTVCASPADLSLPDGDHTFDVRAVDDAGNAGTPSTRSFTVDTVAPEAASIDSGPSGVVASSTATFQISSTDPTATFECSLDGAAFTPCSSTADYPGLGQGGHTFDVRAVDPAGNVGAQSTQNFTVDTIAPGVVTITDGPSGTVKYDDISFEFGSSDNTDHFECSLDGAAFTDCTSPVVYNNLNRDDHTFEVHAVDDVGNVGPPTVVVFTVTAPSGGSGSGTPDPVPSPSGSGEATPEPSPFPTQEAPGGSNGGGGHDKPKPDDKPSDSGSGGGGSAPQAPEAQPPLAPEVVSPAIAPATDDSQSRLLSGGPKEFHPKRHHARNHKKDDAGEKAAGKAADKRHTLEFADKKIMDENKALPLWLGRAAQTVKTFSFPFVLVLLVLLFLLSQHWIDRKTPKLAVAPINARFDIVRFR